MEQTAKTTPAPGRRLSLVRSPRPLDRDDALRAIRRARQHVEDGRFSRAAIADRERRFAHLKRVYD